MGGLGLKSNFTRDFGDSKRESKRKEERAEKNERRLKVRALRLCGEIVEYLRLFVVITQLPK